MAALETAWSRSFLVFIVSRLCSRAFHSAKSREALLETGAARLHPWRLAAAALTLAFAGLPRAIVEKINNEVNLILQSAQGRTTLEQFGAIVGGGTPEDLGALMKTESEKWKRIIESANIRLD